ncbi:MAG: hypothetical protein HRK26_02955 [Rickettsiaceae bacterium H1]|nr:hypothetical protein [Rickettsiaceae bacterium H1]
MKTILHCCIILSLTSCAGSSISNHNISLLDTDKITNSQTFSKIKGVFSDNNDEIATTTFEHIPIHNPGGVQFNVDKDFVKSYNLYKKRMQKEQTESTGSVHDKEENNNKQNVDQFTMYKLLGAKVINTNNTGWDIDYIAPVKEKNISEKLFDLIKDSKESFTKSNVVKKLVKSNKSIFSKTQEVNKKNKINTKKSSIFTNSVKIQTSTFTKIADQLATKNAFNFNKTKDSIKIYNVEQKDIINNKKLKKTPKLKSQITIRKNARKKAN